MANNEVTVINQNPKDFTDGHLGMRWTFKPNEKVAIPVAAAVHIFGFNLKDKAFVLRRLGLSNHPDGAQFLNNFKMEYVEYIRKDDAAEIEQLKIDIEAMQAELDIKTEGMKIAQAEIEQLKQQLEACSKKKK